MAFDSILALFSFLFGHISDRAKTRIGKRAYIIVEPAFCVLRDKHLRS